MKVAAYLLGLGVLAGGVSFGVAGLEAQQSTLMNFCPAKPGSVSCSTAAVMLVSAGDPSDDQLVAYITAIAGASRSSRGCPDTSAGLQALVSALDSEATRGLAQQVVERLCGVHAGTTGSDPVGDQNALNALVFGKSMSSKTPAASSSGASSSSGQSSGSSGQTSSGASGNTSSGASGNTSGGASGQTSSGASGNTSSGASGTSGQTSSGASGDTSSGNTSGG
jgi:hypothetical protein